MANLISMELYGSRAHLDRSALAKIAVRYGPIDQSVGNEVSAGRIFEAPILPVPTLQGIKPWSRKIHGSGVEPAAKSH